MPITKFSLYPHYLNQISHIFKVLGCPARLTILKYLLDYGPSNNKQLVEYLQLKQSTVSEHLKQLISIDLVEANQQETSMIYKINVSVWQNMPWLTELFDMD